MNFFKNAYITIRESFYSKDFYAQLPGARRAFGALTLIGLVFALQAAFLSFFGIQAFLYSGALEKAAEVYPKDLVVEIKNGVASTNVEEPYFIAMPRVVAASSSPKYLAVIDTRPDLSIDTVTAYDAAIVLLQKQAIVHSDSDKKIIDLKDISELKINRANVESFTQFVRPFIKGASYALPVFLLLFLTLGFLLYNALIALPSALIIKLIAYFKGASVPFGRAYRYALFALIPVAIISLVLKQFDIGSSLINLVIFIAIVTYTLSKPTTTPVQ